MQEEAERGQKNGLQRGTEKRMAKTGELCHKITGEAFHQTIVMLLPFYRGRLRTITSGMRSIIQGQDILCQQKVLIFILFMA